jgi:DNA-binding PadR family transcriptional regulator
MHHHHHFFERMHRWADRAEDALCVGGRGRGHGRGFGHFAAGFMGGAGLGGHGFRTGRKLGSGDLQVVLLALLAEQSSHGYELIKALEERSGGFYSPSPGMIYPALTWLEEVGYANVTADGAKKLYSITEAGREHLQENRESADAILDQLAHIGRKMGRVREIFSGHDDADDERGASREVWLARHELRRALRDMRHASSSEASRIAQILRNAAAEILKGK